MNVELNNWTKPRTFSTLNRGLVTSKYCRLDIWIGPLSEESNTESSSDTSCEPESIFEGLCREYTSEDDLAMLQ